MKSKFFRIIDLSQAFTPFTELNEDMIATVQIAADNNAIPLDFRISAAKASRAFNYCILVTLNAILLKLI